MCGKGQVHTLEAIMASGIILTTLFIAMTIPTPKSGLSDFKTLQLKKYADDILTLLTVENNSSVSILYHYIQQKDWTGFKDYFDNNISKPLQNNLYIGTRMEIYDVSAGYKLLANSTDSLPKNADVVSSFRVLIVNNSVYEVRLYVWFE